jgi:hypothetical protein
VNRLTHSPPCHCRRWAAFFVTALIGALVLFWSIGPALPAEPAAPIDGPATAAPGDLVILTATVPAKNYAWTCIPANKKWLAVEGGKQVVFANRTVGTYTFVLATAKGDVAAVAQHVVVIGEEVVPERNPWVPSSAWESATATIRTLKMSRADSIALAKLYGDLSTRLSSIQTTGDLRAALVREGSALSLKGKYPGLADAVDKYLIASIRLENVALNREAAAPILQTLAWAIWEAGK